MALPDYEIHISDEDLDNIWDNESDSDSYPFHEDIEELDRIIEEEIGPSRRRSRGRRS